jgi:predicted transcriptional regulator
MRLHINLDEELVGELDRRAGRGRRSAMIARIVERALEDERRWDQLEAALGGIESEDHDWDSDPAGWVRAGRRADPRRSG